MRGSARFFGRGSVLRTEATRTRRGRRYAVLAALLSVVASSCSTSDTDVPFGFAGIGPADLQPATSDFAATTTSSAAPAFVMDENDPSLPDAVASAPQVRPGSEADAAAQPLELAAEPGMANEAVQALSTETAQVEPAQQAAAVQPVEEQGSAEDEAGQQPTQFVENAPAPAQLAAAAPEPKKRGFLSSFFGTQARAASAPQPARPLIRTEQVPQQQMASAAPLTQLTSTQPSSGALVPQAASATGEALPGVRQNSLFEIKRRSGLDDDSDIDLHEGDELYEVASAAGLARLAPNGLMKQTEHVDVACLKPSLVRVLKSIEGHYGKKAVVTSGYRSADRNRQARGARNSLHMYCAAADIQVEGINKWDLASYVRSMPGRGGVGTYCHTNSVHVDVGPERDWNWRCRRRK